MPLARTPFKVIGPSSLVVPNGATIRGLQLEMLEKYTTNHVSTIARWLTKRKRYFKLMNYPIDLWANVIATCITDTT